MAKLSSLEILLEENEKMGSPLDAEFIKLIFKIEERVQFDGERASVLHKLKEVVKAQIEKVLLEKDSHDITTH